MNPTIYIIALAQLCFMCINMMYILTSSLVGTKLAPSELLSTAPLAAMLFAILAFTPIANKLMSVLGQIYIFRLTSILLIIFSVIGYISIILESFNLFMLASIILGICISVANFFRFAAMQAANKSKMTQALSLIMLMGVASSLIAPNLSKHIDLLLEFQFSAVYLAMTPFALLMLIVFLFIKNEKIVSTSRTKVKLAKRLVLPSIHATIANAIMVFVMGVTPAAMSHMNFSFSDSAFVIQWHMLGMFAPSLFSAWIIKKIGVYHFQYIGAWILLFALCINLVINNHLSLTLSLLLLGIGWNFVYIGASTQLVRWCNPPQLGYAQARNEMMIFALAGTAMLFSGSVLSKLGWELLNAIALVPVIILIGLLFYKPNHVAPNAQA
mgnify:CR=1 FL=1